MYPCVGLPFRRSGFWGEGVGVGVMCVDAPRFRAGFASDEEMRAWVEESKRHFALHEAPSKSDCEQVLQQITDSASLTSSCRFTDPTASKPAQTPDFFMKAVRDMSGY